MLNMDGSPVMKKSEFMDVMNSSDEESSPYPKQSKPPKGKGGSKPPSGAVHKLKPK